MLEYAVFPFLAAGAFLDLEGKKIPNWFNAFFLVSGLTLVFSRSLLSQAYLVSLGFSLAFAYLLFRLKAWGGGDAKFFTALSAWASLFHFSPLFSLELFLSAALLLAPAHFVRRLKRPVFVPFLSLAFLVLFALKKVFLLSLL